VTARVLLADDEPLVRAGYRMILQTEPEFEVVGEASDGLQAVDAARRLAPDIVLMDIRMPRLDGISATRKITALDPAPAVLVVTTFDLDQYVFSALKAGACGFLLKDAREPEVLAALRGAHDGVTLVSSSVTRRLIEQFVQSASDPGATKSLTAREREVLTLIARGLSNADIASAIFVEESTVKTHVSRLLSKLGLTSRTQLVALAYESGLVTPGRS
jgi:DNA-binding NarL/FixJ family response regulator